MENDFGTDTPRVDNAASVVDDELKQDPALGLSRAVLDKVLLEPLPEHLQQEAVTCVDLFNEDKALQAVNHLRNLEAELEKGKNEPWHVALMELLHSQCFLGIKRICDETQSMLKLLSQDDGWVLMKDGGGRRQLKVYHRTEPGTALHGFKIEAILRAPLQNLLVLVNEVDLYSKWLPFLVRTDEVAQFHRCSKVAVVEFKMVWPFSNRDLCVRGVATDGLDCEAPNVTLTLKSYEPAASGNPQQKSAYPARKGVCRLDAKYGAVALWPLSKNTVRIAGMIHVDPKLSYVPSSLINWIATYLGYYGVIYFERKARQLRTAPKDDAHLARVATNRDLYGYVEKRVQETLARCHESGGESEDEGEEEPDTTTAAEQQQHQEEEAK